MHATRTRLALVVTMGLALCVLASPSSAQFYLRTAPAQLNTDSDAELHVDKFPRTAGDGSGNWVAVWERIGLDPGDYFQGIAVSRSSDNGATWTSPVPIDPTPTEERLQQNAPEIVTDGAGRWVATWSQVPPLSSGEVRKIYASLSLDNGVTWSEPCLLGPGTGGSLSGFGDPTSIATDGAGNWVVVWARFFNGDIRISRSTDGGVTWSSAGYVSPVNDGIWDGAPRVATDGAGRWITVWHSGAIEGGPLDQDIVFAVSDDNGVTWSNAAPIDATNDLPLAIDYEPDILFGVNHWVVVWYADSGTVGSDYDLLVSRSGNNGATWTEPALLDPAGATDGALVYDVSPRLTTDRAGNWMVGWRQYVNVSPEANDRNYMARSSDNGATWAQPIRLLPDINHEEWGDFNPCVQADGAGNWLVVWEAAQDVRIQGSNRRDWDILFSRWTGILAPDHEGDNLSDADEATYGSNSDSWDSDSDTLSDADEVNIHNTSPAIADTDGDGVWDFIELEFGTDPNDALDFPLLPLRETTLLGIAALTIAAAVASLRRRRS